MVPIDVGGVTVTEAAAGGFTVVAFACSGNGGGGGGRGCCGFSVLSVATRFCGTGTQENLIIRGRNSQNNHMPVFVGVSVGGKPENNNL